MNRITSLNDVPSRLASAAAWLMLWLLTACAALPDGVRRDPSQALTDVTATPLAREAALANRLGTSLRLVMRFMTRHYAAVPLRRGYRNRHRDYA